MQSAHRDTTLATVAQESIFVRASSLAEPCVALLTMPVTTRANAMGVVWSC